MFMVTSAIAVVAGLAMAAGEVPPAPAEPQPPKERPGDAEPVTSSSGFRRPATEEPGCVGRSVRIPEELQDLAPAIATVKFAVMRDGRLTRFAVLNSGVDPRIGEAIREGLEACSWRPGADAEGRPMNMWVILPFRFQGE